VREVGGGGGKIKINTNVKSARERERDSACKRGASTWGAVFKSDRTYKKGERKGLCGKGKGGSGGTGTSGIE